MGNWRTRTILCIFILMCGVFHLEAKKLTTTPYPTYYGFCPPLYNLQCGYHCYINQTTSSTVTFAQAQSLCSSLNASLPSIQSAEDQKCLERYLRGSWFSVWLGLQKGLSVENKTLHWQWPDPQAQYGVFLKWSRGEPSAGTGGNPRHCAEMSSVVGEWRATDCNTFRYGVLCESHTIPFDNEILDTTNTTSFAITINGSINNLGFKSLFEDGNTSMPTTISTSIPTRTTTASSTTTFALTTSHMKNASVSSTAPPLFTTPTSSSIASPLTSTVSSTLTTVTSSTPAAPTPATQSTTSASSLPDVLRGLLDSSLARLTTQSTTTPPNTLTCFESDRFVFLCKNGLINISETNVDKVTATTAIFQGDNSFDCRTVVFNLHRWILEQLGMREKRSLNDVVKVTCAQGHFDVSEMFPGKSEATSIEFTTSMSTKCVSFFAGFVEYMIKLYIQLRKPDAPVESEQEST